MSFSALREIVNTLYGPALALYLVFPEEKRHAYSRFFLLSSGCLFVVAVVIFVLSADSVHIEALSLLKQIAFKVYGLFLLMFSGAFILVALEAYFRSYYFRGLAHVLSERTHLSYTPTSWEVGAIVALTDPSDITGGFLSSEYGQEVLYRAGIHTDAYAYFLSHRTPTLTEQTFSLRQEHRVTLETYAKALYEQDESLRHFLTEHRVTAEQFSETARLVGETEGSERRRARWWSRDNLGRIPGLGKSWGYGETTLIRRFGHDLTADSVWGSAMMHRRSEDDEVEDMEQVLVRGRQANVLLVGDDTLILRERAAQLYHKILEGHALPPLEGKRILLVDLETLITTTGDKSSFENTLRSLCNQAINAGDVILYIERFSAVLASARTLGTDLTEALMPYFSGSAVQLICTVDQKSFDTHVAQDARLMQVFDVVHVRNESHGTLGILEARALARERSSGVVLSIPALEAIGDLAERYFPMGTMPDKALDLLEEVLSVAQAHGVTQVVTEDVERLVHEKTGIPAGAPTDDERAALLSLEKTLHERVVGQEAAVGAVSRALRRARAGVGRSDKPMGSFLFLGPTGVGKTETAKALAQALFGGEDKMVRLDMSEYQGADALSRLIGTEEEGSPGTLTMSIENRPYGVLLLDEFEKSHRSVHDLFLQILDEGRFTNAAGHSVSVCNLLIIATSNAGAGQIWAWQKEGLDLVAQKRAFVDHLIRTQAFRPEFLNRFDDIILFHPLAEEHVQAIAQIHLRELKERLRTERGLELIVTSGLVRSLAQRGYDPELGGRPLERMIKEKIEQIIADRILAGTLKQGDTLELTEKDIT